jgi:hypothetical protein
MIELKESQFKSKQELEKAGVDWDKLQSVLKRIEPLVRLAKQKYDIEEEPPKITGEIFNPGSWIGSYPGVNIRVVPEKIRGIEYEQMRNEVVGWIEVLGAPFFLSLLPFFPSELLAREALYTSYSSVLINYTESLLSHQLPREMNLKEYVGPELRGRALWRKTLELRLKDPTKIVSQQVKFTFRTLPNTLLTRFHITLARGLSGISAFCDLYEGSRKYHTDFVSSGLPVDLLDHSLEVDFSDPEILERTRKASSREMEDIIDLWEAFLERRTLLLDIEKRFDAALKPMSKVYELWCLKVLCDILEIKPPPPEKLRIRPWEFKLKDGGKLYYNKVPKKKSGILGQILRKVGKPDYAISIGNKVVCVADAKYREFKNIGLADYQRFLSYILDFVYPSKNELVGLVFHISKHESHPPIECKQCKIFHISLRPYTVLSGKSELKQCLQDQQIIKS